VLIEADVARVSCPDHDVTVVQVRGRVTALDTTSSRPPTARARLGGVHDIDTP
jgi:hypothetical protein